LIKEILLIGGFLLCLKVLEISRFA
jgi:hypothetical protein